MRPVLMGEVAGPQAARRNLEALDRIQEQQARLAVDDLEIEDIFERSARKTKQTAGLRIRPCAWPWRVLLL